MEKTIEERAIIEAFNYANGKSLFQQKRPRTTSTISVMNNAAFLRYNLKDDEKTNSLSIIKAFANGYLEGAEIECKPSEPTNPTTENKPVSIVIEDSTPVGVAVQTVDERFEIALKDIDNGREMTWDDAMKFKLPTKKQAAIICAYLDDINAKLKEAGGEPLDKWYWTSSESPAYNAWLYYGSYGRLDTYDKSSTRSVRPVLAF